MMRNGIAVFLLSSLCYAQNPNSFEPAHTISQPLENVQTTLATGLQFITHSWESSCFFVYVSESSLSYLLRRHLASLKMVPRRGFVRLEFSPDKLRRRCPRTSSFLATPSSSATQALSYSVASPPCSAAHSSLPSRLRQPVQKANAIVLESSRALPASSSAPAFIADSYTISFLSRRQSPHLTIAGSSPQAELYGAFQ